MAIETDGKGARPGLPMVPAIVGPTASGKTDVAHALALLLDAEVVSVDSRQLYRGLDIGTAKSGPDLRAQIPYHCVDILELDQEFSAGEYARYARDAVASIHARGKYAVAAGGSGLYLRALIDGLYEGPGKDARIRNELQEKLQREGPDALLKEMRIRDPEAAMRVDPTKPRRLIRALEAMRISGMPLSQLQRERRPDIAFHSMLFGLSWSRERLYQRIGMRCDHMLAAGLLEEVRDLSERGFGVHINALNTVGYKEFFRYLSGEIQQEAALEQMKQNTRRYAKRQMTWFRADRRIRWLEMEGRTPGEVAEEIARLMRAAR